MNRELTTSFAAFEHSQSRLSDVFEAFDLVLGGAAQHAFDINQEPDAVRDRYGRDSMGEKELLARRLVEAGVTYVTLSDA